MLTTGALSGISECGYSLPRYFRGSVLFDWLRRCWVLARGGILCMVGGGRRLLRCVPSSSYTGTVVAGHPGLSRCIDTDFKLCTPCV